VPRILVADDNTNIQKMVALAFEERGIDVVSVGNGEAAVRRIPDLSPDLVLADVFMPVRNGYEVCEFVKNDDRFSHVPVILLVGAFDPLDEKEARRVGADGVLKKPFVPPDPLIAMVTSALEKNPKVAAEMAKAREVPAAPAPEPISPLLETPARMEPKPLPEYPEPTPEEAAVIYGFGKGRSLKDEEENSPKELSSADAQEEDFDGSSTTTDWRRNAAHIEVPEEIGSKPAFAANVDEDFSPSAFPSQRDLLPRHLEDAEERAPAQMNSSGAAAPPQLDTTPVDAEAEIPPFPLTPAATDEIESASEAQPQAGSEPAPPPKSKLSNWIDTIASPSEYAEGGWMSSIFGGRSKDKRKQKENDASAEPIAAAEASSSAPHAVKAGDESRESPNASGRGEESPARLRAADSESWLAPPPPPVLGRASEPQHLPAFISPEPPDDLMAALPESSGSQRDRELEVPAAPHVTREPLLVNEHEPQHASPFGGAAEMAEPVHRFFPPALEAPVLGESDDPAIHEPFNTPIFAPAEWASVMNAVEERIPTAPPPNREALADIPFLTPPPPGQTESKASSLQESPSVDAVVAKVLEKLEPQLHQLLSQGLLKPLVENLLQQELKKTEK
jgi:CheY-like chemotaxis protein